MTAPIPCPLCGHIIDSIADSVAIHTCPGRVESVSFYFDGAKGMTVTDAPLDDEARRYEGMTRPGVYLDILRGGPSVMTPKCARCGYASCPGSPCAVYDAPKPESTEQWASATIARLDAEMMRGFASEMASSFPPASFGGIPFPTERVSLKRKGKPKPASLFDEAEVERFIADQDALRRKIAYSLFRIEVQDEVMRICEQEPFVGKDGKVAGFLLHNDYDHVLRVMWTKTRLGVRERCEAKAEDIADMMAEPPKEETP